MATVTVYGTGTDYLPLPHYEAGSVTLVAAPDGYTVPDYTEIDGMLVAVDSEGRQRIPEDTFRWPLAIDTNAAITPWVMGLPYTVTLTLYSVAADDVDRLRRMVNEPTAATYDDAALADVLERVDYDLNAAAAELWTEKAAAAAARFDFRDPSGEYTRSQLHAQYLSMAAHYASLAGSPTAPGVW